MPVLRNSFDKFCLDDESSHLDFNLSLNQWKMSLEKRKRERVGMKEREINGRVREE